MQKILDSRAYIPRNKDIYLFTGLLRCPVCGHALVITHSRIKGNKYNYYICRSHTRGNCTYDIYLPEKEIEESLLDALGQETKRCSRKAHKILDILMLEQERLKEQYIKKQVARKEFDIKFNDLYEKIEALQIAERKSSMSRIRAMNLDDLREYYSLLNKQSRKEFWKTVLVRITISDNKFIPVFNKI